MERRLLIFCQSIFILFILGIFVQAQGQPVQVTEIPNNSTNLIKIGDLVYFTAGDALWRTDGTKTGTILLKSGFGTLRELTEFKGMAIFVQERPEELWRTDGTPEGTIRLKSFTQNYLHIYDQTPNYVFFRGYESGTGTELYRTDGTPTGTILVRDIYAGPGSGYQGEGVAVGNYFFFPGRAEQQGEELWKSDGTTAGTTLVKDINPGPGTGFRHGGEFSFNNKFYFNGYTPENGTEPWVSDGTPENTILLKDTKPGPDSPWQVHYHIANNGILYFSSYPNSESDISYTELWKTDGTPPGTVQYYSLTQESPYSHWFSRFLIYNGEVHFVDNYEDEISFWRTDGTTEGTNNFISYSTSNASVAFWKVVKNNILFYLNAGGTPHTFDRTDGTKSGTATFATFGSGAYDQGPRTVTKVSDLVFYGDHAEPASTDISMNNWFQLFQADGFTATPVRDFHGGSYIGTDNIVDFNGKVLFTTLNDHTQSTDFTKRLWIYNPADSAEPGAHFTLVNADTDEDIQTINDGDVITKSESSSINIRYNPVDTPGSVKFSLNGARVRTENALPYSLAGDVNGDYAPWQGANPGSYELTATPYSESGGNGAAGTPHTVNFTIEEIPSGSCTASGTILREFWDGVPGSRVSDIPVHTEPTSTSQLAIFEGPTNAGTNYGARIRGYICPPATGDYVFWIASNDHSELWLSTDEDPNNKVRIASVEGATTPYQWAKFPSQKSTPVSLIAGQQYYIEALHKQGVGTDNLAVGWQLPDGTLERPIAGNRLSPFSREGNQAPIVLIEYPYDGQAFNQPATITIEARASDHEFNLRKVEFFEGSNKLGEDATRPYTFTWSNVQPGTYRLTARAVDDVGASTTSHPHTITVNEGDGGCTASGTITREYWANVPGSSVSDIPLDSPPTSTNELMMLEGPTNIGTNYGTRIRGYICPPVSAGYNIWISSNDHSELWLSTDDDPANKVLIGYVDRATGFREWNKHTNQGRTTFWLEAGKRYYIEVLHKQGSGTDHVSVGWQLPDGTMERPIPGNRLSPYVEPVAMASEGNTGNTVQDERMYSQIHVYPNPAPTGNAELRVSGYEGIGQTIETQVEIINLTGEVVYAERIHCGGDCSTYLMNINEQLLPGVYLVKMITNGTRFSMRLLVK